MFDIVWQLSKYDLQPSPRGHQGRREGLSQRPSDQPGTAQWNTGTLLRTAVRDGESRFFSGARIQNWELSKDLKKTENMWQRCFFGGETMEIFMKQAGPHGVRLRSVLKTTPWRICTQNNNYKNKHIYIHIERERETEREREWLFFVDI